MYRAIFTAMLIAVLVLLAEPGWAADGVTEINQTRAMAGGVTAGDVAGFPVSISETGSYLLTSNLIVPDENTNAILLVTSSFVPIDVTIDLNGFTIQGPVVCNRDQGPTVCPGGGSGDGVTSGSFNGLVRVRNGTIRGMGGHGVSMTFSGSRTELENLTLVSNAETGATILQGEVRDSRAERNGSNGFWFFSAGSVLGSRLNSLFNGGHGFALRGETRLVDCVAANNDGDGFGQSQFPVGANLITGCVATNNGGNGLSLAASDGYGSCSIDGNGGSAVTGGLKVSPSTCGAVLCP